MLHFLGLRVRSKWVYGLSTVHVIETQLSLCKMRFDHYRSFNQHSLFLDRVRPPSQPVYSSKMISSDSSPNQFLRAAGSLRFFQSQYIFCTYTLFRPGRYPAGVVFILKERVTESDFDITEKARIPDTLIEVTRLQMLRLKPLSSKKVVLCLVMSKVARL